MDDYNITSLQESTNEWVNRLTSILTPCIIEGCRGLYQEAFKLCLENDEEEKYLMTFQNFLSRIPKWNNDIVEKELARVTQTSGCDYLEDLITCVHVIQLKALTCIRVGMKHKTIDIDIPKLAQFIHKVYIQLARKLYTNVYLFETNIPPLQVQRNNRELEIFTKECILEAIRESIPVESILKAYLDETIEENVETLVTTVKEERKEVASTLPSPSVDSEPEQVSTTPVPLVSHTGPDIKTNLVNIETTSIVDASDASDASMSLSGSASGSATPSGSPSGSGLDNNINTLMNDSVDDTTTIPPSQPLSHNTMPSSPKQLSFSNIDETQNEDKSIANVLAPKDISTLERISDENHIKRMVEEEEDDDEERIKIMDDASISLNVETLS